MCFSATASFGAAAILGAAGMGTIARIRKPSQIALAVVPLVFAAQQAVEGVLWLDVPAGRAASLVPASIFAAIALVVWPILTPLAAGLVEPVRRRRRLILALCGPALVVAAYSATTILMHPYLAWPVHYSLMYVNNDQYPLPMSAAYLVCICAPPLLSTSMVLKIFGAIIVTGLAAALLFFFVDMVSVWCFFCALASVTLWVYLGRANRAAAAV